MVAAQHQRQESFVERFLGDLREAAAGFGDFVQILRALFAVVLLFGLLHGDVADVLDLVAELLQSRLQAGDAQRRRAHVHAAAALAEVHRHSDDANFLRHASFVISRVPDEWQGRTG